MAISTANTATNLLVADLNAGVYKLYTTDAAGNLSAVATNTVVISNTTTTIINLTDSGVTGDEGQLIAPVQVEGAWYYHWDRSGDGIGTDADRIIHDPLDGIFAFDINGVANTTAANYDGNYGTTDTYRYATLNGVRVALPTYGSTLDASGKADDMGFQTGTAVGNATAANGSNADNPTYNDLLAIWDAYNGTGTDTGVSGAPTGWQATVYWSATPSAWGHAGVSLSLGFVSDYYEDRHDYVALQVL